MFMLRTCLHVDALASKLKSTTVQVAEGVYPNGEIKYKCASRGYTAWWQRKTYFTFLTAYILVVPAVIRVLRVTLKTEQIPYEVWPTTVDQLVLQCLMNFEIYRLYTRCSCRHQYITSNFKDWSKSGDNNRLIGLTVSYELRKQ